MFEMEYLFIFDNESKTINKASDVISNLKSNKKLKITRNRQITYDDVFFSLNVYQVQSHSDVDSNACLIQVSSLDKVGDIERAFLYLRLEKELIETLSELKHKSIKFLVNTASAFLAKESYGVINNIENKMRKLITIFMSSRVGADWELSTVPEEVKGDIKNNDKLINDAYASLLYYINFNTLSSFLFKEYNTLRNDDLIRRLKKNEISLDEIKERYIPKNNWERYFQDVVGVKSSEITTTWGILYDLRNTVAHNRSVSESEYAKIKGVSKALSTTLELAIEKVDQILLTDEQKEDITQGVQDEINNLSLSQTVTESESLTDEHISGSPRTVSSLLAQIRKDLATVPFNSAYLKVADDLKRMPTTGWSANLYNDLMNVNTARATDILDALRTSGELASDRLHALRAKDELASDRLDALRATIAASSNYSDPLIDIKSKANDADEDTSKMDTDEKLPLIIEDANDNNEQK